MEFGTPIISFSVGIIVTVWRNYVVNLRYLSENCNYFSARLHFLNSQAAVNMFKSASAFSDCSSHQVVRLQAQSRLLKTRLNSLLKIV